MVVFKQIIVLFLLFECVLCRNRTGTPCSEDDLTGVCKRIYQCPYAVNLVDGEEKKAPTCEFDGMVRIVCCPSQNLLYRTGVLKEYFKGSNDGVIRSKDMTCRYEGRQPVLCCQNTPDIPDPPEPKQCPPLPQPKLKTKVQHFAWQKCVNYQRYFNKCISVNDHPNSFERINTCGIPTNNTVFRIFGGTPAMPRQFPHMAVVGCHNSIFTDDVDVIWVGGGSLISEKFILTAAHVLVENLHGRIRYAMMGTLNKTDTKSGILYNVIRIINHKAYQKGSKLHDIALLELNERVKFNEFIRPACLPVPERELEPGMSIAGWGETDDRGKGSEVLLTASVNEVRHVCENRFDSGTFTPLSMICASGDVGTNSSDACRGDSGGPLMAQFKNLNCSYSIEGVVSYGPRCGQSVGVYTRVSYYLDWIVENVWPDEWRAYQKMNKNT
ncbi:phenoloxidase-activating factor 1-like [Vanessa cardui]|uniref:phenoloxidase-activating factor 1-like n=1 Tax=Vanessa cardui TaxID=171605 RepID=UPI001F135B0C|nr:phenoloxidase-activating factor 1-like [Vanessa cardui]